MHKKPSILPSYNWSDVPVPLSKGRLSPPLRKASATPGSCKHETVETGRLDCGKRCVPGISLLSARHLSKTYVRGVSRTNALQSVGFDIDEGGVVGLLGPNGSGKSTLMGVLAGICLADSGAILWRGQASAPSSYLAELGGLLEGQCGINERLSTLENARYFCGLREQVFNTQYFFQLVELLGVTDPRKPVRLLSSGNRMRSSLVATLIHRPALVMLDEPTNGLDAIGEDGLEALVRELSGAGTTFLISSHDLGFIERLCHRIVCLRQGQVVFEGRTEDFLTLDFRYRVEISFHSSCAPVLPVGCSWSRVTAEYGEVLLRDYGDLCFFLERIAPDLSRYAGFQVKSINLRDKYLDLVFPERTGNPGGRDAV